MRALVLLLCCYLLPASPVIAGGAACVVQRDCPKNEILDSHFMSDGSFAWDVYVPQGGSAKPMTLEGLKKGMQYLDVLDPVGMKERLERLSLSNWLFCIDKALDCRIEL